MLKYCDRSSKVEGCMKNWRYESISCLIRETIQDVAIVTKEDEEELVLGLSNNAFFNDLEQLLSS